MKSIVSAFRSDASGATAVEYALMIGFVAIVIVIAVSALGSAVRDVFDRELNASLGVGAGGD
jgi:Flp pilus assembly pilin Flp